MPNDVAVELYEALNEGLRCQIILVRDLVPLVVGLGQKDLLPESLV